MGIIIFIVAVECAILLIGNRLPNKWNWKLYGVTAFTVGVGGLCLYLGLSNYLERRNGRAVNAEACAVAQRLIRAGYREELGRSLDIDWFKETGTMDFRETSELFLLKVRRVETGEDEVKR